jgi:hypothetical protein
MERVFAYSLVSSEESCRGKKEESPNEEGAKLQTLPLRPVAYLRQEQANKR